MESEQTGTAVLDAPKAVSPGTTDTSVTDGETSQAEQTDTATPTGTEGTESSTAVAEETPETTEAKTRRDRQREARKQAPPPPAPAPSREQIIAEWQQEQEAREAQDKAVKERTERFGKWRGDLPADPANPTGPTVYEQHLAEARAIIPEGTPYGEELDALILKKNKAVAELQKLDDYRGIISELEAPAQRALEQAVPQARAEALSWLGNEWESALSDIEGLDAKGIFEAGKGQQFPMRAAIKALAKELRAELSEDLEAANSEIDSLRRQLGGAAPQPERGGVPGSVGHIYTRAELAGMELSTYRANKAEIERQDRLGLIK